MAESGEAGEEEIPTVVRIFVGGLGESVTGDDLRNIFSSSSRGLGKVETVEIIRTKGRSFAYIDFFPLSHNSLSRLFSTYNGCVWKGGKLRLEKAKADYLSRLKKEWDEDAQLQSLSSSPADKKVEEPSLPTKEDLRDEKIVMFFPRLGKLRTLPLIGTGKHKYSFRRVDVPPLPKHFCDCEEHCDYAVAKKQNPASEEGHDGLNEQEIDLMNSVMNRLFQRGNFAKPSSGALDIELAREEHEQKEPALEGDGPADSLEEMQVDDDTESDEDNIVLNIVDKRRKTSSTKEPKDSAAPKKEGKSLVSGEGYVKESIPSVPQNSERSKSHLNGSEIPLGALNIEQEKGAGQSTPSVSEKKKSSWKELVGNGSSSAFSISEVLQGSGSNKKVRKSDGMAKSSPVDERDEKSECELDETEVLGIGSNNQLSIPRILTYAASSKLEQTNSDDVVQTSPGEKGKFSQDGKGKAKLSDTELMGDGNSSASNISDVSTNSDFSHDEEEAKSGDVAKLNFELSRDEKSEDSMEDLADVKDSKQTSTSSKTGRGSAWLHSSSWMELISGNNSSLFSITQILPGEAPEKQESPVADAVKAATSASSQLDDGKVDHFKCSGPVSDFVDREETAVQDSAEFGQQSVANNNEESAPTSEERPALVTKQLFGETCSFMRSTASLKEWTKAKAALSRSRKRRRQ